MLSYKKIASKKTKFETLNSKYWYENFFDALIINFIFFLSPKIKDNAAAPASYSIVANKKKKENKQIGETIHMNF